MSTFQVSWCPRARQLNSFSTHEGDLKTEIAEFFSVCYEHAEKSVMKIYLRELSEEEKNLEYSEKDAWVQSTILAMDEKDPDFFPKTPLPAHKASSELGASSETLNNRPTHLGFRIRMIDEIIMVDGNFDTQVELICSRCAVRFYQPCRAEYNELLSNDPKVIGEDKPAVNVTPLTKDFIDLREILTEQLQLQVPLRPLCSESCKGICPNCGADLNTGRCACSKILKESPFSVLKDFKLKDPIKN
jgi:uncharacterized protein